MQLLVWGRPLKTCDRCDRRSCQEGWSLCQIVVSWDLFFGACHFCSMKTVDLATSYLFSLSALTAFIVFYCYCMLGKVTQHSISVYFCMLFIILLLYAHKQLQNTVLCFYYHRDFVANHAVLVSNFEPLKIRSCQKEPF